MRASRISERPKDSKPNSVSKSDNPQDDLKADRSASVRSEAKTSEAKTSEAKTIEAEIRATRKFSLAEAIGREGGSFLRSDSTIPRPLQAANIITHFIQTHADEPTSAFSTTLQAWSTGDIRLNQQLDTPLNALSAVIDSLLDEPTTFYEFARQIAIAQSQLIGTRPYFQNPNQPPHPEADYTHATIRAELIRLQQQL